MKLPPLTVIPAGAGSGKTWTLQQRLGEWVSAGLVRPERIVAVTFTEAAAGELRERIRGRLVELGRLDDALRLDQASISTIHAFGQRLLTDFAFDHGASPTPRLVNEDEKNLLVRQAIAQAQELQSITSDLKRHGYTYQHGTERSAEDSLRDDILKIISLLRATGWVAADPAYAQQAVNSLAARYGATFDGAALTRKLEAAVRALLAQFPESLADRFPDNATATKALGENYANLRDAARPGRLDDDWKLWSELAKLRGSKRGAPMPEGYDALAQAVIEAASDLHLHPGPLASAQAQARVLVEAAQGVLLQYAANKRAAGLIDYDDMIALANQLLSDGNGTLEVLRQRVDCLVVDEFQDTNPLQFTLLWQLTCAGVPTLVVGDLKQAIMGFQGADARLFEALQRAHADQLVPLTSNWRSQPAVMDFVNALGPRLFPESYQPLAAQAPATEMLPLEAVVFAKAERSQAHVARATAIGARLKALLEDPAQQVIDRHAKTPRRLRGSDIAVLCRTREVLAQYAEVFRALGLRVQMEARGWYGAGVVQLALAALSYVADPDDRHAALTLVSTELGDRTLTAGLDTLMRGESLDSPLLSRLRELGEVTGTHTVYRLVAETLSTLELYDTVMRWPDARQHRANLLRLQAEAGEFMEANPEALACGGFHGAGLQSFLAWLAAKIDRDERVDTQPVPAVLDEHAIELVTWHSAKGREWPVVVVAGLERKVDVRFPQARLVYADFSDLSAIVSGATLEYTPAFDAPATKERVRLPLFEIACEEDRRLLYVAITRAREKLILEWPAFCAKSESTTLFSLLTGNGAVKLEDDAFVIDGTRFPCRVQSAGTEAATPPVQMLDELLPFGRRALATGAAPPTTPDLVNPSELKPGQARSLGALDGGARPTPAPRASVHQYAPALDAPIGRRGIEFGTALHRCFEVLVANPAGLAWLPEILCVDAKEPFVDAVARHVAAFDQWLAGTWPGAVTHREWPVLVSRADGSVLSGTLDLVVQLGADVWVIDHKSDLVSGTPEAAAQYVGQLSAYADALAALGYQVRGLALHWIRQGTVQFVAGNAQKPEGQAPGYS